MYAAEYAVMCHKGLVRAKNQDNFWCAGVFLGAVNEGLPDALTGAAEGGSVFAVFDGMGGEQQGEMASYIAASAFGALVAGRADAAPEAFLHDACMEMNKKICEYRNENRIRQMGTTAAIVLFAEDGAYICNIGDSRVYQYGGRRLARLSVDHSAFGFKGRKPPLTQCLGIPASDFVIKPHIAKHAYKNGDRYLICSDGLTDMVPEKRIKKILSSKKGVRETVETLLQTALAAGGVDNITVVLCEVRDVLR
jgi:protein phosphatase